MGQRRRHAPAVGQGRVALDRRGRSQVARLARRHRRRPRAPARRSRTSPPASAGTASRTRCCSAWAAPACVPRCSPAPSDTSPARPELHVLDSTVPSQVAAVEGRVDLDRTLVIVASKSGSTLEPSAFQQYFFQRVAAVRGPARSGAPLRRHHRSRLEARGPGEGGRLPAHRLRRADHRRALLGAVAVRAGAGGGDGRSTSPPSSTRRRGWWTRSGSAPAASNPGVSLGLLLGTAAVAGRDKLTLIASPGIEGLGAWLEQLVAESTGKNGQSIVPVDLEALAPPDRYGADRVFVYLRLATAPDAAQDAGVAALEAAGAVVVRIDVARPLAIGQEFFRWEIATAVASHVMRLNPFDQPDVEASKIETKALTSAYERDGSLPAETPAVSGGGLRDLRRREDRGAARGGRRHGHARGVAARAPRLAEGRRLRRAARLRRDERPPRRRAAAHPPQHPRSRPRRDLRRLRAALPALDRPGLQGRLGQGRVPPDHRRRRPRSRRAGAGLHVRRRQGGAGARRSSRCSPSAAAACSASISAPTSRPGSKRLRASSTRRRSRRRTDVPASVTHSGFSRDLRCRLA